MDAVMQVVGLALLALFVGVGLGSLIYSVVMWISDRRQK